MTNFRCNWLWVSTLVLCLGSLFGSKAPLACAQSTFLSFDAPGAGTGKGQGTVPTAINANGAIVGYYLDSSNDQHAFLRAADGTFTNIDVPGALATDPIAISSGGLVVGGYSYFTSGQTLEIAGFLRYANGEYLTLSAPGTGYAIPLAINDLGQIAGEAASDTAIEGFFWTEKSRFTLFKVPFSGPATAASAINASGQIAGDYLDQHIAGRYHAFIRHGAGQFTTLDFGMTVLVASVLGLNDSGQAVGWFEDASHRGNAFVTDSNGVVTVLPAMGRIGDYAVGINNNGVVVGYSTNHFAPQEASFIRDASGNITTITLPFSNVENFTVGINSGGQVAGGYLHSGVTHGWLMMP